MKILARMRIFLSLLLIFGLMFSLSGCTKKETEEESEISEESEQTMPEVSEDPVSTLNDYHLQTAEDVSALIFYEDSDYEAGLYFVYDEYLGCENVILRIVNHTDESVWVELNGIVINGDIYVPFYEKNYAWDEDIGYYPMEELLMAVREIGPENVHSIKIGPRITVGLYDEKVIMHDYVTFELEDGLHFDSIIAPYLGAMAGRQVLLENEDIRVTLLGAGEFVSSSPNPDAKLLLLAENLSDHEIPCEVDGIAVNGFFMDVSRCGGMIRPGHKIFLAPQFMEARMEENRIDVIRDLKIELLTSSEDNTGYMGYHGGDMVDIVLTGDNVPVKDDVPEGEKLFEHDGISVWYLGENSFEYSDFAGQYRMEWEILIINDSDLNVDVRTEYTQFNVDGDPALYQDSHCYLSPESLAAHTRIYSSITAYVYPSEIIPEVSVRFSIQSQGGGEMLYLDDQYIKLPELKAVQEEE